ncbi:MAG: hypothetical protein H7122_05300, partial [Chitinophagaceae bacterium]|nr:hypothetical protein [Chitinophagaceae bacterium]
PGSSTPTTGREHVFTVLPPDGFRKPAKTNANFHAWNLQRRFGDDYRKHWAVMALDRTDNWGLTTIANWSDPMLWEMKRKPYVIFMRGWGIEQGVMGLADIYVPNYKSYVDSVAASQAAARKNDPWLIGYFLGNEPPWPDREALVIEKILSGRPTPMRKVLEAFLAEGDTPDRRKLFVHQTFEKFLSILNEALKKYDPNHLNLGIRFGGTPPEALIKMARSFDVYSFNIYAYAVSPVYLDMLAQLTDKPMLIGEYHFGTPGRGLAAGLGQVADQKERGVAYQYYTENAFAHPSIVGTYWFTWYDQPNTGRNDGENYNIGVVDVTDRPYKELIKGIVDTHKRLYNVHAGKLPAFNQMPKGAIEPDYPASLLKPK